MLLWWYLPPALYCRHALTMPRTWSLIFNDFLSRKDIYLHSFYGLLIHREPKHIAPSLNQISEEPWGGQCGLSLFTNDDSLTSRLCPFRVDICRMKSSGDTRINTIISFLFTWFFFSFRAPVGKFMLSFRNDFLYWESIMGTKRGIKILRMMKNLK